MTREEAYIWNENSHDEKYSTVQEMEESIHYLLKRIYDSFENRSCENCIHYKQSSTHIYKTCYANKVNGFNLESDIDFYCNKWEKNES